ncbi:hypothetical protein Ddc_19864 [Ditylenchus destructor]|nr:hypothetical protein Ddc_19864 [Ditylenchus destructor]
MSSSAAAPRPAVLAHVEEHGPRGVAHVGHMDLAVRELPDQPAVDGAEGQLAALGLLARAGHVLQDPLQLGPREIRVHHQPRLALDQRPVSALSQLGAARLGAAVLPDDRVMDGPAGLAVPHQRGLALVGDAQRLHVGGLQRGLGEHLARHRQLRVPDFIGIVLDPARPRIVLAELPLRHRDDAALRIEHDGAGAGGALVQGQQIGHGLSRSF